MSAKYRISLEERERRRKLIRAVRALQNPDVFARGGKTRGDRHAREKTGVCGRSKEKRIEDARQGGLLGGSLGAANPASIKALFALTQDRQHQRFASHRSNHIRRGRLKPDCDFCAEESEQKLLGESR
jgi:hypothetical protein